MIIKKTFDLQFRKSSKKTKNGLKIFEGLDSPKCKSNSPSLLIFQFYALIIRCIPGTKFFLIVIEMLTDSTLGVPLIQL